MAICIVCGAGAGAGAEAKIKKKVEPELEPKLNNFGSTTLEKNQEKLEFQRKFTLSYIKEFSFSNFTF